MDRLSPHFSLFNRGPSAQTPSIYPASPHPPSTPSQVRTKNLFNVADCKMHWQKCGDYLCVKVARYAKAKREKTEVKYSGIYYNFEIFHMREKGIPVDSLEIKENIQVRSWVWVWMCVCVGDIYLFLLFF